MKTKVMKQLLVLIGSAALLAGCATSGNRGAGGMGNDSQTVTGRGADSAYSDNPLGLGNGGSGIIRAH
jgi:hypothetical protein